MLNLHNSMWPGIVGKGSDADEPVISIDQMINMTVETEDNSTTFDGIDLNVMAPHLEVDADGSEIRKFIDMVDEKGLNIGSVGATVWPDVGGGSAMGSAEERGRFLDAVRKTCQYAAHGVRVYGIIRIDSAASPVDWADNPAGNTTRIAQTFREAADIAADFGERLAAEGEICWAGMHSWKHMLDLLEETDCLDTLGFQADLSHTYLYLLGYNAPDHALFPKEYSEDQFWDAYKTLTDKLGPWTIDFHVAQSDGTIFGSGAHDKTGRHCPADDPEGKLDVVKCARHWLLDGDGLVWNGMEHICWDGCMFPNETLESSDTWENVLSLLKKVCNEIETQTNPNHEIRAEA